MDVSPQFDSFSQELLFLEHHRSVRLQVSPFPSPAPTCRKPNEERAQDHEPGHHHPLPHGNNLHHEVHEVQDVARELRHALGENCKLRGRTERGVQEITYSSQNMGITVSENLLRALLKPERGLTTMLHWLLAADLTGIPVICEKSRPIR